MQNTSKETFTQALAEVFIELQSQGKQCKEKDSAMKKLDTRRAIEDYQESRRLRESLDEYSFDI